MLLNDQLVDKLTEQNYITSLLPETVNTGVYNSSKPCNNLLEYDQRQLPAINGISIPMHAPDVTSSCTANYKYPPDSALPYVNKQSSVVAQDFEPNCEYCILSNALDSPDVTLTSKKCQCDMNKSKTMTNISDASSSGPLVCSEVPPSSDRAMNYLCRQNSGSDHSDGEIYDICMVPVPLSQAAHDYATQLLNELLPESLLNLMDIQYHSVSECRDTVMSSEQGRQLPYAKVYIIVIEIPLRSPDEVIACVEAVVSRAKENVGRFVHTQHLL